MLEASERQLAEAGAEERGKAETFAAAFMTAQMEQDLIPADDARRTVAEHKATASKEWQRAVYAALVGLRALRS